MLKSSGLMRQRTLFMLIIASASLSDQLFPPCEVVEKQEIGMGGTFIQRTWQGGGSSEKTHAEGKSSGKFLIGRKSTTVLRMSLTTNRAGM